MKIIKSFLFFLLCLSSFISNADEYCYDYSSFKVLENNEELRNKVYVQPEQIFITFDGIFILEIEGWVRVLQLNCDENGIYYFTEDLDKITDKCPNGHKIWCGKCGGCVTRWCRFRCRCVEWE